MHLSHGRWLFEAITLGQLTAVRVVIVSHTYILAANRGKLEELSKLPDVELLVITPRTWVNRDIGQRLLAEPSDESLRIAEVRTWVPSFGSLGFYAPFSLFTLLRDCRPDVVHIEEEPWGFIASEVSLFCWALGVPFTFFTWENTERPFQPIFRAMRRLVFRSAAGAVAGNREAETVLRRGGFLMPVDVIPQLGVQSLSLPGSTTGPSGGSAIGYIGRLVPQKGLLVLLQAFARLPREHQLLVVGTGPLKKALLQAAGSLGIADRLELREDVPHREVARYFERMRVLVLPSLTTPTWKEQFGHVLVEAMAAGVPVIGSDSGAIPDVIGDAGIVVPEGEVEPLTLALHNVLTSGLLHADLAARGYIRVSEHFTNKAIAQRLLAFLRSVRAAKSEVLTTNS